MAMATSPVDNQATAISGSPISHRQTSCTGYHRRKVRCDGKRPCSRCSKDDVACRVDRHKSVKSSSRRTESPGGSALALRVRQYECLLRAHGIDLDGRASDHGDDLTEDIGAASTRTEDGAADSQSQSMLRDSFRGRIESPEDTASTGDSTPTFDAEVSTTPELLIWGRPNFAPLRPMHPTVPQIMLLWQAFLSNFDPLVKLFHAPTAQVTVSNAATNLDSIASNTEALMFAIYLSAAVTMTEQQCAQLLETSKAVLVKRFANATQQALVNARFLKSTDLVVLQALTLYLLAARSYIDKQALWILAGIAARLGETMSLNEERGLESLSPFEVEMRRRLWSQIHLVNKCPPRRGGNGDTVTAAPSNCNDSDLFPSMTKLPDDCGRGTEMVFCALHRDVGYCLARLKSGGHGEERGLAYQLGILADFESRLEQLSLKCDQSSPLHVFTVMVGRSVAAQLRFTVHVGAHSGEDSKTDRSIPNSRVSLREGAIEILDHDAEIRSNQALQLFLWHPIVQFPFDAFVFVLRELRGGLGGEERSAAWVAVNRVYEDHPEFVTQGENPLYAAAGDLAVRAWDATVGVAESEMDPGAFENPVESHALARLREDRAGRMLSLARGGERGEGDGGAGDWDLGWEEWQQMLHDAGYWQGFALRARI